MKFYEKDWFVILMLILCFPVGLFLMWKYSKWPSVAKIVVTIVIAVIVVWPPQPNKTVNTKTGEVATDVAEKATEVVTDVAEKATEVEKETAKTNEDKAEDNVPTEYKNALKTAKSYDKTSHMSKQGLYDQLTSEFEQFTPEAAQYAVDNVNANWKENALKTAKSYQEYADMSTSAIYDQLISDFEQFTPEEAQYAIDNLK